MCWYVSRCVSICVYTMCMSISISVSMFVSAPVCVCVYLHVYMYVRLSVSVPWCVHKCTVRFPVCVRLSMSLHVYDSVTSVCQSVVMSGVWLYVCMFVIRATPRDSLFLATSRLPRDIGAKSRTSRINQFRVPVTRAFNGRRCERTRGKVVRPSAGNPIHGSGL